jgi:hypothetical protein
MRIATVQPCYLPWKGYFHLIESVDHFVFFDDVQYPRGRTWRNRNQIVVNGTPKWINVPVDRSAWRMNINEVSIREPFADEHWRLIVEAYRKAACFEQYEHAIKDIVLHNENMLCRLTVHQTRELCRLLRIETPTSLSSELGITGLHKTDRLVEICRRLGATEYMSGPSARDYLEEEQFVVAGIKVSYFDYRYPAYRQLSNEFTHFVSIIDMIFNLGPEAPNYIWGER